MINEQLTMNNDQLAVSNYGIIEDAETGYHCRDGELEEFRRQEKRARD